MDHIETICANSYRNFHAKGMDYLCLSRTPELTRKVYFFGGDLAELPEIVVPHDHRYSFTTTVLAGAVVNRVFEEVPDNYRDAVRYDHFDYLTPLNGGDGFTWAGERSLRLDGGSDHRHRIRGEHWKSWEESIHTLDIRCEGTVILLEQGPDVIPDDQPTSAFRPAGDRTPPSLSGLYDRMTPDHARALIGQFLDLVGNR